MLKIVMVIFIDLIILNKILFMLFFIVHFGK